MYRSYLLKNQFWAKKGNEKNGGEGEDKVFIKHDSTVGGIYAILSNEKKGVKIIVNGIERWFNNFDKLDNFLNRLQQSQDDFLRIIKRKNMSQRLRMLEI